MIREEDYIKAKNRISELEKEYQEQRMLIKRYEDQQKKIEFDKARAAREEKLKAFRTKFYYLAYKNVISRSGSPEEFMVDYSYSMHKLKSLLRFEIKEGQEFLKFIGDCGLGMHIENSTTNIYYYGPKKESEFSDVVRAFKKDLNALFTQLYNKEPEYTFEDLTGFEPRRLRWLFHFELKSEWDLVTIIEVFGLKLKFSHNWEEVEF